MLNIKEFIEEVLNFKSCCNKEKEKNTIIIKAKKYNAYSNKSERCIDENDINNELIDLMNFKLNAKSNNRKAI
mgnify:CR=1 FL=1|tara:strand:- start:415 stop:633 length:219 start_codon:yes stop_codon:yes gene_type:complete